MSDIPAPCAGVVLAAGSGSRFGEPKAPLEVDGERLVDRSVRVLREGGCDPIFVILGAWEGSVDDALVIVNHGWEEGMGSSLRIALKWVNATTEADYALITLVDYQASPPNQFNALLLPIAALPWRPSTVSAVIPCVSHESTSAN